MFLQNKTRKDFLKRIFRKLKKKKKKYERNRTFITKFSIDPLIRKLIKIVGSVFDKFYTSKYQNSSLFSVAIPSFVRFQNKRVNSKRSRATRLQISPILIRVIRPLSSTDRIQD